MDGSRHQQFLTFASIRSVDGNSRPFKTLLHGDQQEPRARCIRVNSKLRRPLQKDFVQFIIQDCSSRLEQQRPRVDTMPQMHGCRSPSPSVGQKSPQKLVQHSTLLQTQFSDPSGRGCTRPHGSPTFSVWSKIMNPLICATRESCVGMSVGSIDQMCCA